MSTQKQPDIKPRQLELIRGYIANQLQAGSSVVEVSKIVKSTPVPREKVELILNSMAEQPGTGIEHTGGETYKIERR